MKTTTDHEAARELTLYVTNDGRLYKGQTLFILRNLQRRMARGIYDAEKALDLWLHLANAGAQKYTKEFACKGPHASYGVFSKATRREAARMLQDYYNEELFA